MADKEKYEVIIIGGSYAGLSAALALGRSLRKVVIIDAGMPCNKQTPHSQNFLTQDGVRPDIIASKAKEQVLNYTTVTFKQDSVVSGKKVTTGYVVKTKSGEELEAKKLIFATGVKDIMPDIDGFSECWGISVIHCPYCHGYEFRNKKTAILANGERATHLSLLVKNLTDKVTVLTNGIAEFDVEQMKRLENESIEITESKPVALEHENGYINSLIFENGDKVNYDVLYAAIPFTQHSTIPENLGCELTEQGHIKVDMFQKTSVNGIFACGDNSSMLRSVANAVSTGNIAGAMANNELVEENSQNQ